MDKLILPLAYKFVAVAVMLSEVNYCASRLDIPCQLPIRDQSLQTAHVARPLITGFGGTLETETFSFVFFKSGTLRYISRNKNRFENIPLRDLQWKLSGMKSLIDTNQAYHLATNWLAAISVDVSALEKKYQCSIEQTFFYPDATTIDAPAKKRERIVLLPVFHVDWRNDVNRAVRVTIFGPTKELLGMYQEDDSFSRRPKELLKNVDVLLAIPDKEFLRYSAAKRRELVSRFANVFVPPQLLPSIGFPLMPNLHTNTVQSLAPQSNPRQ